MDFLRVWRRLLRKGKGKGEIGGGIFGGEVEKCRIVKGGLTV